MKSGGVTPICNIVTISVIMGTKYHGECLLPASYAWLTSYILPVIVCPTRVLYRPFQCISNCDVSRLDSSVLERER